VAVTSHRLFNPTPSEAELARGYFFRASGAIFPSRDAKLRFSTCPARVMPSCNSAPALEEEAQ